MLADLSGKTALVTGGGQGMGEVIASVLAGQGATITIGDISMGNGSKIVKEVGALGRKVLALHFGRHQLGCQHLGDDEGRGASPHLSQSLQRQRGLYRQG